MGSIRTIHYTTLCLYYIFISSTTLLAQCDTTKYAEIVKPQNLKKQPESFIERENSHLKIGQPSESTSPPFSQPPSASDSISLSPQDSPPLFCAYPHPPMAPPGYGPRPSPPPPSQPKRPKFAVWCVAKPTVPGSVLQQALDYACGTRADCRPIGLNGPCYQPNTILAHASYAFNSYFQRTKLSGGTCDFGGTAMLVTDDPSFDGCTFLFTY